MIEPTWIDGRPDAPGIWMLRMRNRDLVAATVRWDEGEEDHHGESHRYLRIDDGEMSEELDRVDGEIGRWVARSFGPIPRPEDPAGELSHPPCPLVRDGLQ